MKCEKVESIPSIDPYAEVKVTTMGNVIETQYMSKRNKRQTVQMLKGGDQMLVLSTGDIIDVQHHETRAENTVGLRKTFAKMRGIINTNVVDVTKVRWCTLTYAENMTDTDKLYTDFRDFNKRFQRYCKKQGYSKPEYIVMMEPQARGAWHAHLLYIWEDMKAPYIPNKTFADLWGHGFVRIKKLDDVDNVGAYLTAYLGDMDVKEAGARKGKDQKIKEVSITENGKTVKKSIIKGGRLHLYPANFNMLRYSKGIKKPKQEMMSQEQAKRKVLGATKTFQSVVRLSDPHNDFETIILKEQYNLVRGKRQGGEVRTHAPAFPLGECSKTMSGAGLPAIGSGGTHWGAGGAS